jgi:serine protease Do
VRHWQAGWGAALAVNLLLSSPISARAVEMPGGEGQEGSASPKSAEPATDRTLPNFVDLARRNFSAVVNISTTTNSSEGAGSGGPDERFRDLPEPFPHFFGPGPSPHRRFRKKSLGSGFVIDRRGLILTNNHVIEDADAIVVKLADGSEHRAKLLGRDKKTDIALIRIEKLPALNPAVLGDSDQLLVGEWVMAIGNPFGLENTVTAGIVSAKGRHIGAGPYESFIQTDAPINPGNSGGPLINLRGEVVGINSAIYSRGGGNIGIGFASPINIAKDLLPELEQKGRVTRGWLGVMVQKVTDDIANSLGLKEASGALVAEVIQDGPAKKAGIRVGDVIVDFNGAAVKESADLPLLVARAPIGQVVKVKLLRGSSEKILEVKIQALKDDEAEVASASSNSETLGLTVQNVTPEVARSFGFDADTKGVVVSTVTPGSAADDAQLRRGDVILEVDRRPIDDAAAFHGALSDAEEGRSLLLLVKRGNATIFVALKRGTS